MPKRKYALEKGGEKKLEIVWGAFWKDTRVSLEGRELGVIPTQDALRAGREFTLLDGSLLTVRLGKNMMMPELQVLKNGEPLPGSSSDPAQKIDIAFYIILFFAAVNVLLGLVAEMFKISGFLAMGIGYGTVVFGLVYLALAIFIKKRSMVALALAVGLFVLDTVLTLVLPIQGGAKPPTAGIVLRIFLMIPLFQAFPAMRVLRRKDS